MSLSISRTQMDTRLSLKQRFEEMKSYKPGSLSEVEKMEPWQQHINQHLLFRKIPLIVTNAG